MKKNPCMSGIFLLLACAILVGSISLARAATILVEAESFQDPGGWVIDTQSMDQVGVAIPAGPRPGRSYEGRNNGRCVSCGGHVSRVGSHARLGRSVEGAWNAREVPCDCRRQNVANDFWK